MSDESVDDDTDAAEVHFAYVCSGCSSHRSDKQKLYDCVLLIVASTLVR